MLPSFSRQKRLFFGCVYPLALCFLFILACTIHLSAQGLYYDELHQATAAFAYIGVLPVHFANLMFHEIPVLNMDYSGAIKTFCYGMFLLLTDGSFSVFSWRLVGPLFVGGALFVLGIWVSRQWGKGWFFLLFFFFLSDTTILLTTRHDWGPTALGLSLRILFVTIWLKGELGGQVPYWNTFLCGGLVGFAIFEKLSGVVLLAPLLYLLVFSSKRHTWQHLVMLWLGGLVGGVGLVLANGVSYIDSGHFISLSGLGGDSVKQYQDIGLFFKKSFSLGAGTEVKDFILGKSYPILKTIEGSFVFLLLSLVMCITLNYKRFVYFQQARLFVYCYLLTIFALYLLPKDTWVHHWIISTPFQYMAFFFTILGIVIDNKTRKNRIYLKWCFSSLLVLFFVFRGVCFVTLEMMLLEKNASETWDPSYTSVAKFALERKEDSIFISTDWGIGTQWFCFQNGVPDNAFEKSSHYGNIAEINEIFEKRTKFDTLYIVFNKKMKTPYSTTEKVVDDLRKSGQWIEQPPENRYRQWRSVALLKFKKV